MTTMVDVLVFGGRARSRPVSVAVDTALVLAGSLVVALFAQLQYVLPFTAVPITGQTLAVLLVGAGLGSRRGALAMAAYLAEGAAGLPVFAGGGFGLAWLLGPTAGYLWAFPLAAWVVGRLAEQGWDRGPIRAAVAMLAGNTTIYLVALPWLSLWVGLDRVLVTGVIPFVPGDLIKIALAAILLPTAWSLVRRMQAWTSHL